MSSDMFCVLDYYGLYQQIRVGESDNIMINCPFHDDSKPSLSVSFEKDLYHCFGCGVSGGPVDFISRLEGINEYRAHLLLVKIRRACGKSYQRTSFLHGLRDNNLPELYPIPYWELIWSKGDESDLRYYPFTRGILPETLYGWCVGWDALNLAVVFHVSYFNRYVGWQKRFVRGKKKYIFSPGMRRHGLYWSGEFLDRKPSSDIMILTEGPFDALYLSQLGYDNVGAILGSLSRLVVESIGNYEWRRIICAFDNDERGHEYFEILRSRWGKQVLCVDYRLWGGKDVDEISVKDLHDSISNSTEVCLV